MPSAQTIVYLAIPMPSIEMSEKEGTNRSRSELYAMLKELSAASEQLEFVLYTFGIVKPSIQLIDDDERGNELKQWFDDEVISLCEILEVSAEIPFSDEQGPYLSLIVEAFVKQTSDLLVISNLCRVGSVELKGSVVIVDGIMQKYDHAPLMDAWALQRAVRLAEKIGWPKLHTLELADVWKWLSEHKDFVIDGLSRNATGRALCAFSHLFEYSTRDEPMQLLWALVGIEALYVRGKTALIEQVRDKAQILLGEQEAYKKKIGAMYDFRSRFVHGDLDFPAMACIADDSRVFGSDLLESIDMAIAILTATLQEIIRRNWAGLSFTYQAHDV